MTLPDKNNEATTPVVDKTSPLSPSQAVEEPVVNGLIKNFPKDTIAADIKLNNDHHRRTLLANLIHETETKMNLAQSIISSTASQAIIKHVKGHVQALLAPISSCLDVLEIVSSIHPAVTVAVAAVRIVVNMELQRQDNDKQIAVLFYSMSDMILVLAYLDPVFQKEDGLKDQLEKQLKTMADTINEFGNFCDLYYKHHGFVRMLSSTKYKGKLANFASAFADQKAQLQLLNTAKTAKEVVEIDEKLGTMDTKIDQVLAFLNTKSQRESEIQKAIDEAGGESVVLQDDHALKKIAEKFGHDMNSEITYALRLDIDAALVANRDLYNLKLDAATAELHDAMKKTEEAILLRLDDGPHNFIEDEDIKTVWKDMQWRLSCKVRHFVDAVHHHFNLQFQDYSRTTRTKRKDHWTLQYLSKVSFHPAIGDAIDEDGSGYVSVHEVNRFFSKKPNTWTTPEWLAFWAVGWNQNLVAYRIRCYAVYDQIIEKLKLMHPRNAKAAKKALYKDKYKGIHQLRKIFLSIYTNTVSWYGSQARSELDILRLQYMDDEIRVMNERLLKPKFQIDSSAAVTALTGPQLESSFACLIYVIMKHHLKIVNLAKETVLAEQEFTTMQLSIKNLMKAFELRYWNLSECWRQLRIDPKKQVEWFAGGQFEKWRKHVYDSDSSDSSSDGSDSDSSSSVSDDSDYVPTSSSSSDSDSDDSDSDDEYNRSQEQQGKLALKPDPGDSASQREEILVYPLPLQPTEEETTTEKKEREEAKAKKKAEIEKKKKEEKAKEEAKKAKKNVKVEDRIATLEKKIEDMEALLKRLFARIDDPESAAGSARSVINRKKQAKAKKEAKQKKAPPISRSDCDSTEFYDARSDGSDGESQTKSKESLDDSEPESEGSTHEKKSDFEANASEGGSASC